MTKFRREMIRVLRRAVDAFDLPSDTLRRRSHDRRFDPAAATTYGDQALGPKVVIFVTYQPAGMPASALVTARHLVDAGYAVLMVANAPLRAADHDALRRLCWAILQRPNIGYDFGGYRDGIRLLGDRINACESLILLNDSIWFPTMQGCDLLQRLEADPAAFCGASLEKRPGRSPRGWHYQSYLLQFKPQAMSSEAFRRYWRWMRLSDKKRVVLKYGEKGLSQAMFRAGFGGDGPPLRERLFSLLASQDADVLQKVLRYAAYDDRADLKQALHLLAVGETDEQWRSAVLAHMKAVMVKLHPIGAFCYAAIQLGGYGYMKKTSAFAVYPGMRFQFLQAAAAGDLPEPDPAILAEIGVSHCDPVLTTARPLGGGEIAP